MASVTASFEGEEMTIPEQIDCLLILRNFGPMNWATLARWYNRSFSGAHGRRVLSDNEIQGVLRPTIDESGA